MRSPVTGMRAYGTHQQPAGTWSDDTSMTLCALESLSQRGITHEEAPEDMMRRFCRWMREGYWTPYGEVFDMGGTTFTALQRYESGEKAENCSGKGEWDNGNGSLMRILPAALFLYRRMPAGKNGPFSLFLLFFSLYHSFLPIKTAVSPVLGKPPHFFIPVFFPPDIPCPVENLWFGK